MEHLGTRPSGALLGKKVEETDCGRACVVGAASLSLGRESEIQSATNERQTTQTERALLVCERCVYEKGYLAQSRPRAPLSTPHPSRRPASKLRRACTPPAAQDPCAEKRMMKLDVKNMRDREICSVRVLDDARVADLKKEIAESRKGQVANWACYGMRLIYNGYRLDNRRRLDSYGIRDTHLDVCSSILVFPSKKLASKRRRYSARLLLKHEVQPHLTRYRPTFSERGTARQKKKGVWRGARALWHSLAARGRKGGGFGLLWRRGREGRGEREGVRFAWPLCGGGQKGRQKRSAFASRACSEAERVREARQR